MLTKRLLILVMGLGISYTAVFFGEGVVAFVSQNMKSAPADADSYMLTGLLFLGIFFLGGAFAWGWAIVRLTEFKTAGDHVKLAAVSAGALILLGAAFGMMALPFAHYGGEPWFWTSRVDVFLALALLPTLLELHDILIEAAELKSQPQPRDNVRPLRKTSQ
jgi:hypothetical protein